MKETTVVPTTNAQMIETSENMTPFVEAPPWTDSNKSPSGKRRPPH